MPLRGDESTPLGVNGAVSNRSSHVRYSANRYQIVTLRQALLLARSAVIFSD
jgi:hypothetical protein